MADFDYVAIDTRGAEKRGHVAAADLDAARQALDRQKLYVVRIEPAARGRCSACNSAGRACRASS